LVLGGEESLQPCVSSIATDTRDAPTANRSTGSSDP